jgi:hypothetical protein
MQAKDTNICVITFQGYFLALLPDISRHIYNQRMTTALIYDPLYLRHETGFHPENAERLRAIAAVLDADEELQARVYGFGHGNLS